jgi:hypothetical protein
MLRAMLFLRRVQRKSGRGDICGVAPTAFGVLTTSRIGLELRAISNGRTLRPSMYKTKEENHEGNSFC